MSMVVSYHRYTYVTNTISIGDVLVWILLASLINVFPNSILPYLPGE